MFILKCQHILRQHTVTVHCITFLVLGFSICIFLSLSKLPLVFKKKFQVCSIEAPFFFGLMLKLYLLSILNAFQAWIWLSFSIFYWNRMWHAKLKLTCGRSKNYFPRGICYRKWDFRHSHQWHHSCFRCVTWMQTHSCGKNTKKFATVTSANHMWRHSYSSLHGKTSGRINVLHTHLMCVFSSNLIEMLETVHDDCINSILVWRWIDVNHVEAICVYVEAKQR